MDNKQRVSLSFDAENVYGMCVCRNLSTRFSHGIYPSDRCRAGDMVATASSPLPACWLVVRCENTSARVILHDIVPSANNTLLAHLPAPEETRQFVDVTTMVVANNEDDAVTTICSAV